MIHTLTLFTALLLAPLAALHAAKAEEKQDNPKSTDEDRSAPVGVNDVLSLSDGRFHLDGAGLNDASAAAISSRDWPSCGADAAADAAICSTTAATEEAGAAAARASRSGAAPPLPLPRRWDADPLRTPRNTSLARASSERSEERGSATRVSSSSSSSSRQTDADSAIIHYQ